MARLSLLYASALFDLAKENGKVQDFYDQAVLMRDSLNNAECVEFLLHPHVTADEKHEFFKGAFSESVHEDLLGFLFLTADKNREAFILPALSELIELIERHNNKVRATVTSAAPLSEGQISEMKSLLSEKLGKTVEMSMKVDTSLIGGPFVFVDGYYVDWTVKKRMRDLKVQMKEGCSA